MSTSASDTTYTNALVNETSPYLLQHAHNPVQWFPWSSEALEKARQEDKPILLSIGYSACHWCHVMAHESFEDPATAQVMNQLYVNIKVDREERPDLDRIYQLAHQVLTQRGGGWPLTMVLTPEDQTPFFAGTYFPKQPKYNMPAFTDILRRIESIYREHREEVERQNGALMDILQQANTTEASPAHAIDATVLDEARRQLGSAFDDTNKGFGTAPKFPHPTNIERLLRHWWGTKQNAQEDTEALRMATQTLTAMAQGGLFDQLGGGFCRYSVDEQWMIPHFEKMLYDNGPLLHLYTQAWLATGDALFKKTALETGEWGLREMQAEQGGYFSTLDADSEGEEGKFYVWNRDEIKLLLEPDEYQLFAAVYGLGETPNFEGRWHLHTYVPLDEAAQKLEMSPDYARDILAAARQKLFRERELRVRPGRDEKILVSWNALMIKGMAAAGRVFAQPELVRSAESALDFIRATLWKDGRLLATYKDGKAHLMAYLDDYAFLIDAILELLQARWRDGDLQFAMQLADVLLDHFEDRDHGGFYFTADDHESLIQRPKVLLDDSMPAGNGIAAFALQRLGHLLGDTRYLDAAHNTLTAAWESISRTPYAHNALLLAVEEHLFPTQTIVLRGQCDALEDWAAQAGPEYAPRRMVFAIPDSADELPGLLAQRQAPDKQGEVMAYICEGRSCQAPVGDRTEFEERLRNQ
jgi:uncharacterized protein YyaL (SSP411 family)